MQNCLKSNNYQCPLCKKSMVDMRNYWEVLDNFLKKQKKPDEFKNTYCLLYCNDCEKRNYANYHFIYNKCKDCNGYNTNIIKTKNLDDQQIQNIVYLQKLIKN